MELGTKTIVGRSDGPHLVVTAGVHGDEYEPMAAVRRLLGEFASRPLRGRVTLVPVANEPAFRRGQRTADDGLDLARSCPGRDDGALTERIAAALSRLIRAADYYIDLHTGGAAFAISPLAGYMLHPEPQVLETQRQMARSFNLPIVWGTSAGLEGRTLSVARDARIPAIYGEYGGGGGCDPAAVEAYSEGCLNVAALVGMIERPAAAAEVRYVVEDDRHESGHLQAQHPAPVAGFFEPAVELGQVLQRGRPLGTVVDLLGETAVAVPAADEGMVFFLRVRPPVAAGDSLGGVLPITAPGHVRYERGPAGEAGRQVHPA